MTNSSRESTELWARMRKPGAPWDNTFEFETGSAGSGQWQPPIDIVEASDRFHVRADLPGISVERVEVTLTDGILSIRGAREPVLPGHGTGYHHIERPAGAFQRQFALPDSADPARIRVRSRDGVLAIEILKRSVTSRPGKTPGR